MARISGAEDYKLELSTEGKPERAPYAGIKETMSLIWRLDGLVFLNLHAHCCFR